MRNTDVPIRAATVRERFSQLGAALPHGRGSDIGYGVRRMALRVNEMRFRI